MPRTGAVPPCPITNAFQRTIRSGFSAADWASGKQRGCLNWDLGDRSPANSDELDTRPPRSQGMAPGAYQALTVEGTRHATRALEIVNRSRRHRVGSLSKLRLSTARGGRRRGSAPEGAPAVR